MQIYLNFSSDQIFSISQTAEITSKKNDKQNYMNFHKVSGETAIFVRPKVRIFIPLKNDPPYLYR